MKTSLKPQINCPCGSTKPFEKCCEPYLMYERIPLTAKALMRSRFVAYVYHNEDYLRATWDTDRCPNRSQPLIQTQIQWIRLEILYAKKGSRNDRTGVVAFRAYYTFNTKSENSIPDASHCGILEEISRFVKKQGKWYYLEGSKV